MAPKIGTETRKPLFPRRLYVAFVSAMERRTGSCSVEPLVVDIVLFENGWRVWTIGLGDNGDGCFQGSIFCVIIYLIKTTIPGLGWI